MSEPPPPHAPPTSPQPRPAPLPGERSLPAVLSLVLSILGFCTLGVTSLVAIVLGIVALTRIHQSRGRLRGAGFAIAGLSISMASIVMGPLLVGVMLPLVLASRMTTVTAKITNTTLESTTALGTLGAAASTYAGDNDGRLPPAEGWLAALGDYTVSDRLTLSVSDPGQGRAYAMNAGVAGRRLDDIADPRHTVLFFEAAYGSPPAGGVELLPPEPRHADGYVIVFVSGEVANVAAEELETLVWEPKKGQRD